MAANIRSARGFVKWQQKKTFGEINEGTEVWYGPGKEQCRLRPTGRPGLRAEASYRPGNVA